MEIKTINLKLNHEPLDVAIYNFMHEIEIAKLEGIGIIKFVHGYGASGVGGVIFGEIKKLCPKLKKQKIISDYICGSQWHLASEKTLKALKSVKNIGTDEDLNAFNMGITLIVL